MWEKIGTTCQTMLMSLFKGKFGKGTCVGSTLPTVRIKAIFSAEWLALNHMPYPSASQNLGLGTPQTFGVTSNNWVYP